MEEAAFAPAQTLSLERHVEETELPAIGCALEQAWGSQRQAARPLGISRNTLARKIPRLGLG